MATRQMIGKIAERIVWPFTLVQVQWHFGFIFSLVVLNEELFPALFGA